MSMTIEIQFDGGCRGNPGYKYGSYEVRLNGVTLLRAEQFKLGFGTNNEAEFEALEAALKATIGDLKTGGFNSDYYQVDLITDSKILMNRIRNNRPPEQFKPKWRESAGRMFTLANRCLALLKEFKGYQINWQGREINIAVFGH